MKTIISALALLLLTVSAFAQAPQKMSYQAVIRDGVNALVTNQAVGMQISILQGSLSSPAVYVETQTPTSNINGLVSLEIGNGTVVSGDFSTIDWGNGPYFIQTETDPTGGTAYVISGTVQLLSVPYALHANTADSIVGGAISTELDPVFAASVASGITAMDTANWNNHTIDTDTQLDSTGIASFGYVAGPHTVDTDTQLDSVGIASLGYVAGPHTIDTDTQIDSTGIASFGYVAGPHTVDTDTQIDSLGIASLGYVAGPHTADTQIDSAGIAAFGYVAGSGNGLNGTTNYLAKFTSPTAAGNSQVYDTGSRVGIGTSSPQATLHVSSNLSNVTGLQVSATDSVGFIMPAVIDANTSNSTFGTNTYGRMLRLMDRRTGAGFYDLGIDGNNSFFITENGSAGPAKAMVIQKNTGNLGIGTSLPTQKLHVNGSISSGTLKVDDNNGAAGQILEYYHFGSAKLAQSQVRYVSGAVSQWEFDVLTSNNTEQAHLRFFRNTNTTGNKFVDFFRGNNTPNSSARIGVDGHQSFFQIHGGNMGIGTTAPSEKLHVAGDTKVDSVFTAGNMAHGKYGIPGTQTVPAGGSIGPFTVQYGKTMTSTSPIVVATFYNNQIDGFLTIQIKYEASNADSFDFYILNNGQTNRTLSTMGINWIAMSQ